jgi:hypothetical protein
VTRSTEPARFGRQGSVENAATDLPSKRWLRNGQANMKNKIFITHILDSHSQNRGFRRNIDR